MSLRLVLALLLAAPTGPAMVPDGGAPPATVTVSPPTSRWSAVPRGDPRYGWPTGTEVDVLRPFEQPPVPWGSGHRGVDLALGVGAPVFAAAAGTVAFAGTVVDRPVVSIDHADGIRTTYEPVTAVVAAGEGVRMGQVIGHLGTASHCTPASCLHWGARRGPEAYVDPMLLLRAVVVRLFPDVRASP